MNTPRSRVTEELRAEIQEILKYVDFCAKCEDITREFANTVKNKIEAIDFENLAMQKEEKKNARRPN